MTYHSRHGSSYSPLLPRSRPPEWMGVLVSMPPRRKANLRGLPLNLASTTESMASRIKRLRLGGEATLSEQSLELTQSMGGAGATTLTWAKWATAPRCDLQALFTTGNIITRPDAPIVKNLRRGSVEDVAAGLRMLGAETLVDELLRDRTALAGAASVASCTTTWRKIHELFFTGEPTTVPVYHVAPRSLVLVGALFENGGCRTFANYDSAAKAAHIEERFEWDQLNAHTTGCVTRSVLRGIGPARQNCSFHLARLCRLPRPTTSIVRGGPQAPVHLALLASIYLLPEVEASTATVSAWDLDAVDMELTWSLLFSKTDRLALSTKRTWGCLCGLEGFFCPYHLAREHLDWLRSTSSATPASPLFPTDAGGFASKASVVDTFEALGSTMGQPTVNDTGLRLFGGHTPCVKGAQILTAMGVAINKVRILACHSGDTIIRYVAEAPLKSLRADLGLGPCQST